MDEHETSPPPVGIRPGVAVAVGVGLVGLLLAGGLAFALLAPASGPTSDNDADPLLVKGRAVYNSRCISCHGAAGRGDGPIAGTLKGPPPGNFTDDVWKHGDRPEQVLAVVKQGVPDTAMSGWQQYLDVDDVRAATAFVFHLAGRPVPAELRTASD